MATSSASPGTKPTAVTEVERLGFEFTEVADYDLSKLDAKRRVQVRESGHYAPKPMVDRYVVQMGESPFPPIVVTSDDYIVDGNTRIAAKARRKEKFFPAYVLDVAWQKATAKQRSDLLILAATLNADAGMPLSAKETREVTKTFIERGFKAEQIARAIGVRPASVTAVKKEIDAAAKLERVGLDSNGALKGASLRALGAKEVLALNDVPFKELALLAADAGLNAGEIVATAKAARDTGSDTGAVDYISKERTEFGDRIREHELTGSGKPPVSRQLRQRLGYITKFVGREQELIETDPAVSAQHVLALQTASQVLAAVLKMQAG